MISDTVFRILFFTFSNLMLLGVLLALATALGYSFRALMYKLVEGYGFKRPIIQFSYRFISIPFSLLLIFVFRKTGAAQNLNSDVILLLGISGVIGYVADVSYYTGFSKVEMSLAALFCRLSPIISLLVSYIFLRELPNASAIVGIFVIVMASVLLSRALQRVPNLSYDKKAISLIIASQVFYNIDSVIITKICGVIGQLNLIFLYSIITSCFFLVDAIRTKSYKCLPRKSIKAYGMLFLFSIISFFPFLTAVYAYRMLMLPVAYALVSFSLVFTVILGYLFLGEKEGILQKALTGAMMLLGGWLVLS